MVKLIVGEPFWMESAERPAKRDSLPILDAAYDLRPTDTEWLMGVLRATNAALGRGYGAYAFYYDIPDDLSSLRVQSPVFLDCPPKFFETLMQTGPDVGSEQIHAVYVGDACKSMSEVNAAHGVLEPNKVDLTVQAVTGIADQFIVNAWDTPGHGTAITVLSERRLPFPPRSTAIMTRVSRHIAAARRLRAYVRREGGSASVEADAVLTPSGKVLHVEPNSAGKLERAQLSDAVRTLVDNRERFAQSEPEAVVRLWTALVNGQWSLVSSVDTDGKRFMVARRNAPTFSDPAALTPEERHLAALFASGHSGKLVGYELGLAPSTVSQRLKLVLRKLKLRSVAELVLLLGPRAPQ